jgi:hypothetical protein
MRWVGDVRSYLTRLSAPFNADMKLSSWVDFKNVADDVEKALKPPDQRTTMLVLDIIGGAVSIAALIPEAHATSVAVETIAVAYETGLQYLTQDRGGADEDTITGNADKLGGELVKRMADAQKSFVNIGNILVSDYYKLSTVGKYGGCSPTAEGCKPEWQLQQSDQKLAAADVSKSIEAEFDQKLMGLAFPAWLLGPRLVHHDTNGQVTTNARDYPCGANIYFPFHDEPDNGQVALLQQLPDLYDVLALGNLTNLSATNYIPNVPPKQVLDRMFSPLNTTSLAPEEGGLAIYKPDFMRQIIKNDYNDVEKPGLTPLCGGGNRRANEPGW